MRIKIDKGDKPMKRIVTLFTVLLAALFIHGSLPLETLAATVLEADVVIVGSGMAGTSAGMVALQKGASKVIILEKQSYMGANSSLAGGMIYSPGKTFSFVAPKAGAAQQPASSNPQEAANDAIKETIEFNHYELIDPKLVRALINESVSTGKWFKDLGIDTEANAGAPGSFGKSLKQLGEKFKSLGGQIMMNTSAKKILRDASGKVTGVLAVDKEGKELSIKAGSVILATGGFTGNPELLKKYFPYYSPDTISTEATRANTGEGIKLAADAGAALADYATLVKENGFSFKSGSTIDNRLAMSASLWVNRRGERFMNETVGTDNESANALLGQPGSVGYAIFDDSQIIGLGTGSRISAGSDAGGKQASLKEKIQAETAANSTWVKIAGTLDEIAAWIGADPKVLKATIEEYNFFCDKGQDDALGKEKSALIALRKPPYYALRFGMLMIDTIGPVKINSRMEVLDKDGKAIPGFYAAGAVTSGWQGRDYHLFGSALGLSAAGGRIAGANAVKDILKN
jgi:fumarate reductase flavoprotein subunit